MNSLTIRTKTDGRLDVPKQLAVLLTGTSSKFIVGKSAKNSKLLAIKRHKLGSVEEASDKRVRLSAAKLSTIGVGPGDWVNIKYVQKQDKITIKGL